MSRLTPPHQDMPYNPQITSTKLTLLILHRLTLQYQLTQFYPMVKIDLKNIQPQIQSYHTTPRCVFQHTNQLHNPQLQFTYNEQVYPDTEVSPTNTKLHSDTQIHPSTYAHNCSVRQILTPQRKHVSPTPRIALGHTDFPPQEEDMIPITELFSSPDVLSNTALPHKVPLTYNLDTISNVLCHPYTVAKPPVKKCILQCRKHLANAGTCPTVPEWPHQAQTSSPKQIHLETPRTKSQLTSALQIKFSPQRTDMRHNIQTQLPAQTFTIQYMSHNTTDKPHSTQSCPTPLRDMPYNAQTDLPHKRTSQNKSLPSIKILNSRHVQSYTGICYNTELLHKADMPTAHRVILTQIHKLLHTQTHP